MLLENLPMTKHLYADDGILSHEGSPRFKAVKKHCLIKQQWLI